MVRGKRRFSVVTAKEVERSGEGGGSFCFLLLVTDTAQLSANKRAVANIW